MSPGKGLPDGPLGPWGEAFVRAELEKRGFRLVGHNMRVSGIELDLVMRRRRQFWVIEVKTAREPQRPEENLSSRQLRRLRRAVAVLEAALRPGSRRVSLRLAAVTVRQDATAYLRFFRLAFS
ncbi:MAG: YraN family protein [Planctomycetota bacterium]